MAKIVGFGRYSASGAAGIVANGFTARKETLAATAAALGGSQDGYWVVSDVRWDFMFMWDLPLEAMHTYRAMLVTAVASGGFDGAEMFTLLDTEAVDASRVSLPGYTPPNA